MILPTTHTAALLLLIVSLVCLGSWANTLKVSGSRWRFELYTLDFALGVLIFSIAAAYTLGTLGADTAFSDRILLAGRSAQAWVIGAGLIFCLGNMLFIAAISLLGMSRAFLLTIGIALVIASFWGFQTQIILWTLGGVVLIVISLIFDWIAVRSSEISVSIPPSKKRAAPVLRRSTKGLMTGVLGGVLIGFFYPIAQKGVPGEFGLGPYAGMLMFSIGLAISTAIFEIFFLNIAIEGPPLSFMAYFRGSIKQHIPGVIGGVLCAAGLLTASLALSFTTTASGANASSTTQFILPLASVLLAVFWGVFAWKELAASPSIGKLMLSLAAALYLLGILLLGFGLPTR